MPIRFTKGCVLCGRTPKPKRKRCQHCLDRQAIATGRYRAKLRFKRENPVSQECCPPDRPWLNKHDLDEETGLCTNCGAKLQEPQIQVSVSKLKDMERGSSRSYKPNSSNHPWSPSNDDE